MKFSLGSCNKGIAVLCAVTLCLFALLLQSQPISADDQVEANNSSNNNNENAKQEDVSVYDIDSDENEDDDASDSLEELTGDDDDEHVARRRRAAGENGLQLCVLASGQLTLVRSTGGSSSSVEESDGGNAFGSGSSIIDEDGDGNLFYDYNTDNEDLKRAKFIEGGFKKRAKYLDDGFAKRAKYLDDGFMKRAKFIDVGFKKRAKYLDDGFMKRAKFIDVGFKKRAKYLDDGFMKRAKFLDDGFKKRDFVPVQKRAKFFDDPALMFMRGGNGVDNNNIDDKSIKGSNNNNKVSPSNFQFRIRSRLVPSSRRSNNNDNRFVRCIKVKTG